MSSLTWTPAALRSEARPYEGRAWRLVEAQHVVSTLKLVDRLEEQQLLEEILDSTKPVVPEECRHLDYLLSTPFRYRPYRNGSRFRRAGRTPGVWYGAEQVQTSVAEMVFYRFLFYAESPATPFPSQPAQYTAFAVDLRTSVMLDLTAGALSRDQALWEHVVNYDACQELAELAREIACELIRYRSVRDPDGRAALAVLSCPAFAETQPSERQSWWIRISRMGAIATCEYPRRSIAYPADSFAADPRLAGMVWER